MSCSTVKRQGFSRLMMVLLSLSTQPRKARFSGPVGLAERVTWLPSGYVPAPLIWMLPKRDRGAKLVLTVQEADLS